MVLLVHTTVAFFILCEILKANKLFKNAFYTIYLLQCCADFGDYFTILYMMRLPNNGFLPGAWLVPVGTFLYVISAYFQFLQMLSHTTIALNRYSIIAHPFRHRQ
ncbi:hypothetical protein AAVH_38751, partial [Aphelenchoides avenae]